jgi:hypothetical protein
MMNKFYILEYKMQKKVKCKEKLSEKIRINMREYKENGRWKSPQQAIAVSYSQVLKKSPSCKKSLRSKNRVKNSVRKSKKSGTKSKKSRSRKN